jgi:predicted transcriptional regulator
VEEAVRKHPSLRKLKKVAHVKKIVELADAFQATEERVKAAVNLIVEHKMTPEQIQRAKELRGQGISLRKIARELGVSHETVRQYLKVHEAAPETGIAKENTRQIMSELGHYLTPITRQTAEGQISEAGKAQPAEVKPYLSGLRGVASAFAISPDTVSRSLEVEKAIGRHPCLDRLSRVEDIQELDELAPKISASEEEIEGAVNLIVEHNIPARVALRMQRLPKEKWESFIEVCKKHPRPHYDIEDAVLLMLRYPEKNLTPERAFELASKMEERFVVYLRSGEAYEALEQAAKNSKIAPEQYIAIATVEKLCREGYISDATYLDAVSLARLDRPLCQVI